MGILNATPDSFSDGGRLRKADDSGAFRVSIDKALECTETMVRDGALIVDVGGESTRPGAAEVSEQEEIDRVLPVIEAIVTRLDVVISVDTSSPRVMSMALAAGAGLINDVRALTRAGAIQAVKDADSGICLMHMRGEPDTMQKNVAYASVVDEVYACLERRITECIQAGIDRGRLLIDPGFGFGKTLQHNYELLRHLSRFKEFGLPLLVGISRKSMIGNVVNRGVEDRLAGSLAATIHALIGGAAIIRTHDVAATVDAIKVHRAVAGI
ncbi:MAG: dihydropteroate synthase [Gammaproteobacteria bacterium]|nr:dihydropteroate synthase [Gammaproteobacteria bacterium]MDP2139865.1 dihydropteroate synthase [Gammaproteobacteria bacterium]MDP2347114.1 dihydropteroate synthase [Gammaproteobacteria bacterium]